MGRMITTGGRVRLLPLVALACIAALLASAVTPATAESPFDVTVSFVGAPATASPGASLGDVEVEVAGELTLPVVDLVDADGSLALTASLALLQGGEAVIGAFSEGAASVPVRSVPGPDDAPRAIASFEGLTLAEDLPLGDAYQLQVTIGLGDLTLGTATSELQITDNAPPVASFSVTCDELTLQCLFEDESTDADGTIEMWEWGFGDGNGVTLSSDDVADGTTTHTYPAADGYEVVLTVTDDEGATDTATQVISAEDFHSDFDEVKDCDVECDFEAVISHVTYRIQGPDGGGRVGVSFDIEPDAAFAEACSVLQATFSNIRVLEPVTLVVPTGFSQGDLFHVTMSVPKRVINEDVNRGNFGVCFRDDPDPDDPTNPFKGTTRLLPACGTNEDQACIVSSNKTKNGTLNLVFRFPAVDPMFR